MSEGENKRFDLKRIAQSVKRFIRGPDNPIREADSELDNDAEKAEELLTDIGPHLSFLTDIRNLPKVIHVVTPTREYISIRRIEGSGLDSKITNVSLTSDNSPRNTVFKFKAKVSPESVEEGQIMIFDTPSTFDCMPQTSESEEWAPSMMDVKLLTKSGGKLFSGTVHEYGDQSGFNYALADFERVDVEKSGEAFVFLGGDFQSQQDLDVNRDYLKRWGKIYTLAEVSSEREMKRQSRTAYERLPSPSGA